MAHGTARAPLRDRRTGLPGPVIPFAASHPGRRQLAGPACRVAASAGAREFDRIRDGMRGRTRGHAVAAMLRIYAARGYGREILHAHCLSPSRRNDRNAGFGNRRHCGPPFRGRAPANGGRGSADTPRHDHSGCLLTDQCRCRAWAGIPDRWTGLYHRAAMADPRALAPARRGERSSVDARPASPAGAFQPAGLRLRIANGHAPCLRSGSPSALDCSCSPGAPACPAPSAPSRDRARTGIRARAVASQTTARPKHYAGASTSRCRWSRPGPRSAALRRQQAVGSGLRAAHPRIRMRRPPPRRPMPGASAGAGRSTSGSGSRDRAETRPAPRGRASRARRRSAPAAPPGTIPADRRGGQWKAAA